MKNIAFIGLGNMGGPMAANLVRNGESVVVFDLVADAVKQLEDKGAMAAASPQEAVKNADVVVTMLPAAQHVKSLYLGEQGIIAHAKTGALFIDCSTIDAQSAKEVGAGAINAGYAFIDAPVSGGTAGAQAGTLTFIVGGEEDALERARPVLQAMGKNIFHVGASGAGQVAKLCKHMALGVVMAAAGYPEDPRKGDAISGLPQDAADAMVFHAGTQLKDGVPVTSGGRVLCVTVLADSVKQAQQKVYAVARGIHFDGAQYRRDIGFRAVKN